MYYDYFSHCRHGWRIGNSIFFEYNCRNYKEDCNLLGSAPPLFLYYHVCRVCIILELFLRPCPSFFGISCRSERKYTDQFCLAMNKTAIARKHERGRSDVTAVTHLTRLCRV